MAKAKFTVNSPVQIAKKRYEEGDTVEIEAEQVQNLIDSGALAKPDAKKGDAKQPPEGEKKDENDGK